MLNSPVYCDIDFLRSFFFEHMPPGGRIKGAARQLRIRWDRFNDFLESNYLLIDKSSRDLYDLAKNDDQMQELLKIVEDELNTSPPDETCTISHALRDNEDCSSSIVLSSAQTAIDYSRINGLLQLTPRDTIAREDLYIDSGVSVEKGSHISWTEICERCMPNKRFNSLIIIDNYAGKRSDKNLYKLLDVLLPFDLGTDAIFKLLIICYSKDQQGQTIYLPHRKNILSNIRRRSYRIDIRVQGFDGTRFKEFHDRAIITNYNFLIAPGGIDLFRDIETPSKNTAIFGVYPDFSQEGEQWKIDYLNNNLYKILKFSDLNNIEGNPIMESYQSSEDCLKRQVLDYVTMLSNSKLLKAKWDVNDIVFSDYDPMKHQIHVSHKHWRATVMDFGRAEVIANSNPGGEHNQFLNGLVLMKKNHYLVDGVAEYWTDEEGRVCKAMSTVRLFVEIKNNDRGKDSDQEKHIQSLHFSAQDEVSHLVARSFHGSYEAINLVPIHNAVNHGLYRAAEQTVTNWISDGGIVDISITAIYYQQGRRPSLFIYEAKNQKDPSQHFKLSIPNSPLLGTIELKQID